MNRIALIALAGLTLSACATQPQPVTAAQNTASLQCQYDLVSDDNDLNYDALFVKSGRPVFDERGNPQGLSGRGFVAYHQCMSRKGYEIAETKPE